MKQPGKLELAGIGVVSFILMAAVVLLISPSGDYDAPASERFAPSDVASTLADDASRVTLDCRDRKLFAYVDLDTGATVHEAGPWDLACRRHELKKRDEERLPKWYRYQMAAHRLEPLGHEYPVAGDSGTTWLVQPESYYCDDGDGGCVTLRYWVMPTLEAPAP